MSTEWLADPPVEIDILWVLHWKRKLVQYGKLTSDNSCYFQFRCCGEFFNFPRSHFSFFKRFFFYIERKSLLLRSWRSTLFNKWLNFLPLGSSSDIDSFLRAILSTETFDFISAKKKKKKKRIGTTISLQKQTRKLPYMRILGRSPWLKTIINKKSKIEFKLWACTLSFQLSSSPDDSFCHDFSTSNELRKF